jgi:hypothetical protein
MVPSVRQARVIRRGVPDDNDDSSATAPPPDKVTYVNAFDRAHPHTSIDAFHAEEDSGRNRRKRDVVAQAFRKFSPGSSAEVLREADLRENLNLWRARVAELTNEGVLKKIGERRCRMTNHEVAILQYVEPQDRVRRVRIEPRDAAILELCDALEGITEDPSISLGNERLAAVRDMIARSRSLVRRDRPRHEPRAAQADQSVPVDS